MSRIEASPREVCVYNRTWARNVDRQFNGRAGLGSEGGMSKALTCLAAGLLAVLAAFPSAPVSAQGYESPPTFSAAKVLPPELLQSPYHKIVGRVNSVTVNR